MEKMKIVLGMALAKLLVSAKGIYYGQALKLAIVLLLVAGSFACGEKETNENPVEIPSVEYSLPENCQWKNLVYGNKPIVINSNDDLKKYITCTDRSFPEIDFSTKTLLFASGSTTYGVHNISTKLLLNNNKYSLNVDIHLNIATVVQGWYIAVLTTKINTQNIELNINQHHS